MSAIQTPDAPQAGRWRWLPVLCILAGAVIGLIVGYAGAVAKNSCRWEVPMEVGDGKRTVVLRPDDPNGYLHLEFFGRTIHEESGPVELMQRKQLWWGVIVAGVFTLVGANIGQLVGYLVDRRTSRCT